MIATLLVSAFLMGLLGSTHCVAMCGGVAGVLHGGLTTLGRKKPEGRMLLTGAYNGGRVLSYAVAGGLAGGVGAITERIHGAQIGLRIFAGLLMVGVGLYLAGWRRFAVIERVGAPIWRFIEPTARRLLPVRSPLAALGLGALWGFMPCGLVYGALGLAIGTGSALSGSATMLAFGVGTLPMLFAMSIAAEKISELARRPWVRRSAGLAVIVFGVVNLTTASAQAGWSISPRTEHACCVQGERAAR